MDAFAAVRGGQPMTALLELDVTAPLAVITLDAPTFASSACVPMAIHSLRRPPRPCGRPCTAKTV